MSAEGEPIGYLLARIHSNMDRRANNNLKASGMTISQVQGCGSQHGWKEYYRGTEVLLNMVPKIKFEIVVDDERVDALVDLVSTVARTGEVGDGKIFIFPVEEVVRIRTGERGDEAI